MSQNEKDLCTDTKLKVSKNQSYMNHNMIISKWTLHTDGARDQLSSEQLFRPVLDQFWNF